MKTTCLTIALWLIIGQVHAQNAEKPNELKIDLPALYSHGVIKVEYAYGDDEFMIGVAGLLNSNVTSIAGLFVKENNEPKYQAQGLIFVRMDYYEVYDALYGDGEDWDIRLRRLYCELNMGVTSGYGRKEATPHTYTAFNVGVAIVKKWHIGRHLVCELVFGGGLQLFGGSEVSYPVLYPRVGISLGKRF